MKISNLSKIVMSSTAAIALATLPMSASAQSGNPSGAGSTTTPGSTTGTGSPGSMSPSTTTGDSSSYGTTSTTREGNSMDWGWLGLLGLAGLAGLRRPKHEETTRYEPTTTSSRSDMR